MYHKKHLPSKGKSVVSGASVIEEDIFENIKGNVMGGITSDGNVFDGKGYSEREIEVIREVPNGLSNKEIAQKLFYQRRHRKKLYKSRKITHCL